MVPLGDRGRPKSAKPKKNVIVFLIDDTMLANWQDFITYVEKRKNFKHKQDLLKFMMENTYKILS